MEYWLKPLGGRGVELTPARYDALQAARVLLSLCRDVLLTLDVFARAVAAFEAALYNRTFAFGFSPENIDPQDYADETRPEVSLHVLTVLTAFRAYVEGAPHLLDKMEHPEKDVLKAAFAAAENECRSNSFDFCLCWELRNAMIHRRPLVTGWIAGVRRDYEGGQPNREALSLRTFTLDLRISLPQLIEEMPVKKGNRAFWDALVSKRDGERIEWIDLKYVIRQLASVIVKLHLSFGETLLPKVEDAISLVRDEVDTASRETEQNQNVWWLEVTGTERRTALNLSKLSALPEQFIQWRRLANLADSAVHLEVARHERTYPTETQTLWRRS